MEEVLKNLDPQDALEALITVGIGLLMGLEREYAKKKNRTEEEIFAGIRTFPLISLTGFLLMFLGDERSAWIPALGTFGFMLFVIASYWTSYHEKRSGGTSQMAMIIAFLLGGMVQVGHMGMAILSGIVVTGLLALKFQLHTAIGRIDQKDIFALLQFVVLSVLVYPLLPDQAYGPYEVLNPRDIWRIVIIILGVDFFGYLLAKFIGSKKGTLITGILGGFASSTAVAWSFSRKSRKDEVNVDAYAGGIVLASSIMFPRVLIWMYLWNQELLRELFLPVVVIGAIGVGAGIIIVKRGGREQEGSVPQPRNPLNIKSAVSFGVLYSGILLLVAFSQENFGDKGIYLASSISGLTDVDAITISMSQLGGERFSLFVSHVSIVIGMIANSLLKYGISLGFGSSLMRKQVSLGFLPMILAAFLYLGIKFFVIG